MFTKLIATVKQLPFKAFNFAGGRSTGFAIFFAINATVLAYIGKLTDSYALAITAIQALVVAHSVKEDIFLRKNGSVE